MITYNDFQKIELRVAKILTAERVEGSKKLLKLQVDAGDKDAADQFISRQVIAGIGTHYEPEDIVGLEIVIVANLEPRMLMGLESQGMLLAAEGPVLLTPDKEVLPGSGIR
ncbi:MAG: methionine--tRNA ligase [Patescibacteria group bacterium]